MSLLADAEAELSASGHTINIIEMPQAEALFPHLDPNPNRDIKQELSIETYPVPSDVESLDAIRFYIHSSGTTSLPKPIPVDERNLRYLGWGSGQHLRPYFSLIRPLSY